ncbi:MAG TPA: RDD family protein [Blastocatellia bacterium]|nr:RDD family protein [Blastocatellia bacterium]
MIVAQQVITIPWAETVEEGEEEIEEIADGLWRVEAALLDALLSLGVAFAALVLTTVIKETPTINQLGTVAGLALAAAFVLNEYVLIPLRGQSAGMKLVGIRLVRDTGEAARPARCLLRNTAGYVLSALPLGLGFFWIFIDPLHQGWHDKIARTVVVKVRRHGQAAYQNAGQATVHG